MQKAVVLENLPTGAKDGDRLRQLVLTRIACALRGATKAEIAADLAPIAADKPNARWRAEVEGEIAALGAQALVTAKGARMELTDAGKAHAARFLGVTPNGKGDIPRIWSEVRDIRLVAVALGMQRETAKRLKSLATIDGLRGAIVENAYGLKIKGVVTPARLREALAALALKRAFGNTGSSAELAGKMGLSAKAGRLLAGQLARAPRDFGTDTRLIAALAAEHLGSGAADISDLRLAVLRKFFGAPPQKTAPAKRKPSKRALGNRTPSRTEVQASPAIPVHQSTSVASAPTLTPDAVTPPTAFGRPDLPGFASEVRRHAASHARGWSGDRKAYISHVWRNIREQRPEWGLSEIEFKSMLTLAHRAGQLALANADLKDKDNIKDVQDSAVSFHNAVFHFIRVDA